MAGGYEYRFKTYKTHSYNMGSEMETQLNIEVSGLKEADAKELLDKFDFLLDHAKAGLIERLDDREDECRSCSTGISVPRTTESDDSYCKEGYLNKV